MKTKTVLYIIGALIILLGIFMFGFGVSMFTYQGNGITPFESKMGMYSFFCWAPTIILGIVIVIIAAVRKK